MHRSRILLTLALLTTAACTARRAPAAPVYPSQLRSAPSAVVVDGRQIVLATSLRREGGRLVAVMRVQTPDGRAIPASVRVDTAWVINEQEVWTAVPRRESAGSSMYHEVVARGGPRWNPASRVDVVVSLQLPSGESRLLLAANQPIRSGD